MSRDRLVLTMIIDDPKMYTKTWVALDKFPFKLMPPTTDVREMMCAQTKSSGHITLQWGSSIRTPNRCAAYSVL